jgi:LuxR family transcriptional regulator, maltose regulon positive regulatory protein
MKITPPRFPDDFVRRPALLECLDRATDQDLTLLCAPPGFGKSLLLADWVRASADIPAAWVTLDEEDNDPRRFWSAVLAALQACPAVSPASRLHRMVVSRTTVEFDFLDDLLDALEALPERIRLILDDGHHVRSGDALHHIERIIRSPGCPLRIVLASRHHPDLSIARMRVEDQLCELRADQLRFSPTEAAELLARQGIRLSPADTALLCARTGGWVAGLRLAADQALGHPDPARFIASFSGDEAPVADYLVGEILSQVPDAERRVLLRISIANPVPAGLAVRLSGSDDAAELLDRLGHDTGLVSATGQHRAEYRVQELLRSYLVADLQRSGPGSVSDLHREAALWWSDEGQPLDALRHAVKAGDGALLSRLLHRWGAELAARGEHDALLDALTAHEKLTTDDADPWLAVLAAQFRLGSVGVRRQVEEELRRPASTPPPHSDVAQLHAATQRLAWLDSPQVDDEPEPNDPPLAAIALAGRAAAQLARGEPAKARADAAAALERARRLKLGLLEVQCLCLLGTAAWRAGEFREAAAFGSAAVAAAQRHGCLRSAWAAVAHAVEAHAALLRAQPDRAEQAADQGLRRAPEGLDPVVRFGLRLARGAAVCACGDPTAGLQEMQRARAELGAQELPRSLATAAGLMEHGAALLSGHHTAAAAVASWLAARDAGLPEKALMRAGAEAATGAHHLVRATVSPILSGEARPLLATTYIEAALLDADAALKLGDRLAARHSLRLALERAEELDALRPFALIGPELSALLVDQLSGVDDRDSFACRALAIHRQTHQPPPPQLSGRERDVLYRLPSLSNLTEIATDLDVSINTVKSHVRAIYSKLGVSSRRTAVLAAHEHGLLRESAGEGTGVPGRPLAGPAGSPPTLAETSRP